MAKQFCKVVPLRDGGFAVQSKGAQWGVYDTPEAAQEKADRLNDITDTARLRPDIQVDESVDYEGADRLELAMEARKGEWFSPSRAARLPGVRLNTTEAFHILRWMDKQRLVLADGNGAWRKYSYGRPGPRRD